MTQVRLAADAAASAASGAQSGADDEQLEAIVLAAGRQEFAAHRDGRTVRRAVQRLIVLLRGPARLYRRAHPQRLVVIQRASGLQRGSDLERLVVFMSFPAFSERTCSASL